MKRDLARRLRRASAWIDSRAPRERALAVLAGLALMAAAWSALVHDPAAARSAELALESEALHEQIDEAERRAQAILAAAETDPDRELRGRLAAIREQLVALDAGIQSHTAALLSPADMARFLETLLLENGELRLLRLRNEDPSPLFPSQGAPAEAEAAQPGLFRHDFELVLEGSFLATLRYLEALEALRWHFFWESLDFEVLDHPKGRVVIRCFTLGAREGWIGA